MSSETIVYGRITGSQGTTQNWYGLYKLNRTVIDHLPGEDTFPPLLKSLFITPLTEAGPTLHRSQVITFGASFKNFDDSDHRLWISKFEALLKQLYWLDAVVHFDIEFHGRYEHRWTATDQAVMEMRSADPKPVSDWIYSEKQAD